MKPTFLILMFCLTFFCSCENKEQAKIPGKDEVTGAVHCALHNEKCLEEETRYLIGSISWTESYEKAKKSGAFKKASEEFFPNANDIQGVAHPGTEFADEVKDKVIRRRYCASCRTAEAEWWDRWNKASE